MHSQEQATPCAATASIIVQTTENEFNVASALLSRPARQKVLLGVIASAAITAIAAPAILNILSHFLDLSFMLGGQAALLVGTFVLLYCFLLRGFSRFYQQGRFAPDGNYLLPTLFSLSPTCLSVSSRYLHTTVDWPGVSKIIDDQAFLFFYVDRMHAFIIPKRCFAAPEAAAAFYQQAQSYWQAAHQQLASQPPSPIVGQA